MVDTVKITRASGEPVTDPETWEVTFPEITVYEGRGRVVLTAPSSETTDQGAATFTIQSLSLHVPVGAGPLQVDDLVEITASPLDPSRVGRTMNITALHDGSLTTAQRVKVEQITG